MATPKELEHDGKLSQVDPEDILEPYQVPLRSIYLLPRVEEWIEGNLYDLETDGHVEGALRPSEQLFELFRRYIAGEDLAKTDFPPKQMRPGPGPVWELRTADLRVFGWCWRHGIFIASGINTAAKCKVLNLYAGYREQCKSDINMIQLDDPKAIIGDETNVF